MNAYTGALVIAVSGNNATVANVCLDGSGSLEVSGAGDSVTWAGTLVCPAVPFTNCAAVTLTYSSATITLGSNDVLTVVATGHASGCGTTLGVTSTLSGSRQ